MFDRRSVLMAGAGLLALAAGRAEAQAITALQIFVPAAPGGGWDQTGRAIEAIMKAEKLVQTTQVEHAPGAGGAVGLPKFLAAKKGQPNALIVGGLVMVGALITNKAAVKISDTVPIARLTGEAEVIVVNAASPLKTMKDLADAFKADPGKVSWAGGSAGGTDHILAGMIARAIGADPKKVAYVAYAGGGPAQAALLGNQVTAGISGWGEFAEQVKAGKLRALAVSGDVRIPGVDVPTLKESGVDVALYNWRGVFGAPGTTPEQQATLVALVEKMAKSKAWTDECEKKDWLPILLTGEAFAKFLAAENERITTILKDIGLA